MKYLLLSLILAVCFCLKAQNPGYLGKKNVIEVFGSMQIPLFPNMTGLLSDQQSYMKKGGKLEAKKDWIDLGYHVNVSHAFSRKFGMALEFGYDYFSVTPNDIDYGYEDAWGGQSAYSYYGEQENFSIRSQIIIPKLEFSGQGGLLPVGITHQIGFGFRNMNVVKKDYLYDLYSYYSDGESLTSAEKTDYEQHFTDYSKRYKGKTLIYTLNLRSPVSNNLMLNYGVRYTMNFMKKSRLEGAGYEKLDSYWHNDDEIAHIIRSRSRWSFIYLYFGLSFAF